MYLLACRVNADIASDEAADFLGAGRMPEKSFGRDIHPVLARNFRDLHRATIARRYPRTSYELKVAVTSRCVSRGRDQGESNDEDRDQAVHGVLQSFPVTARRRTNRAYGLYVSPGIVARYDDTLMKRETWKREDQKQSS
jgi:hypothetical protein